MPVIGKTLLSMGFGKISFKNIDYNASADDIPHDCYGTVLTTASSSSSVPDHPVGANTFVHIHQLDSSLNVQGDNQGMRLLPIIQVNPYGEYRHRMTFDITKATGQPLMVDAARFGDDGSLLYYDDNSTTSKEIFNCQKVLVVDVGLDASKPVNVPIFRGCLVECYQRVNPKTLNAYARFDFLTYPGLTEPTMNYVATSDSSRRPPPSWNRIVVSASPCSTAAHRTRRFKPIAPSR